MLEQPPSQADMCRELIKPPIVSHFQDTFLAGSLAVAHLTWDQPKARRAADSPFDGRHRLCLPFSIKSAPSGSEAAGFHDRRECPRLLLFLPDVPEYLTNKQFSICYLSLANFQGLDMVVVDNFV